MAGTSPFVRLTTALSLWLALCLPAAADDWVTVKRVIDGDTFRAAKVGKIRLMGIDTPELGRDGKPAQPGAEKAKEALQKLIMGKRVRLEYDGQRLDKYGRILAYVYTAEGLMVNEELLRLGLAEPIRYLPYSRKERFLKVYKAK